MKKKSGQSLLEVVMAMAIAVVVISGLVSAVTLAVRNSTFAKNQTLATKYAQEGLEKVRAYRDQNDWMTFTSGCGNLATMGISNTPAAGFSRSVSCAMQFPNFNMRRIQITVSWTDSAGSHQSRLMSYFTNQALWK